LGFQLNLATKKTEATNPKEGGESKEYLMAHHCFLLLSLAAVVAASIDTEGPLICQAVGSGEDKTWS
jgi:hypothetical protein